MNDQKAAVAARDYSETLFLPQTNFPMRAGLPQQMDEAETKAAIEAAIAETGAASMKDMGKVVGVLRAKYAGRMDFAKASGLVKDMLPKG